MHSFYRFQKTNIPTPYFEKITRSPPAWIPNARSCPNSLMFPIWFCCATTRYPEGTEIKEETKIRGFISRHNKCTENVLLSHQSRNTHEAAPSEIRAAPLQTVMSVNRRAPHRCYECTQVEDATRKYDSSRCSRSLVHTHTQRRSR